MKIMTVNHSDKHGGAAIAAWRIHETLLLNGIESVFYTNLNFSGDKSIVTSKSIIKKSLVKVKPVLSSLLTTRLKTENNVLHSPSVIPSFNHLQINKSDVDIVHLHWINAEMFSVKDISLITKPVVWTLHDMWAFCGAEHYTNDLRWKFGYTEDNRPVYENGFDLNKWTWQRKIKAWRKPFNIVTPSNWLAKCVQESALMKDWPITVIPNSINTSSWIPIDKKHAKTILNIPLDCKLILFGAMGGGKDPRKGIDLLLSSFQDLKHICSNIQLAVFGQDQPDIVKNYGLPINYLGHVHDEISLRVLYSAADVMVIPSRQDNLPNTGLEALSCGTPLVAFDTGGLSDLIVHKYNGWLAKPFDSSDLAKGIYWTIENEDRHLILCENSRSFSVDNFSQEVIFHKYKQLYETILNKDL